MPTANSQATRLQSRVLGLAASNTLAGKFLLALSASGFVALCAHITVPLPFTPVPLTFSDFAVLLVGLTLGPSLGFAALVMYLVEGACGVPVFAPTGPGGLLQLFGHTGGYLMAYPIAAAIAGSLARTLARASTRFIAALTASSIASAFLMTAGTIWLGLTAHLTATNAFLLGAAPFLFGQVIKVLAAAGIFASLVRWRRA